MPGFLKVLLLLFLLDLAAALGLLVLVALTYRGRLRPPDGETDRSELRSLLGCAVVLAIAIALVYGALWAGWAWFNE